MRFPRSTWMLAAACGLLAAGCTKQMREARELKRADRDLAAGAMAKAEVEYMRARVLAPLDADPMLRLGLLYQTEGRNRAAYAYLKRVNQLEPQNVRALAALAQVELDLGGIKEARESADAALALDPANEPALVVLQRTVRTAADAADATRLVAQLRGRHADCAGYHLVLAGVCAVRRDASGAERELRAALELDPHLAVAHEQLAEIALGQKNIAEAKREFELGEDASPLRSETRLRALSFALRAGDAARAKRELAEVNARAPDYVPGWVFTMRLADAEHRADDAAAAMGKVLALDPTNLDAMQERARLKEEHADYVGAIAEWNKANEAYPRLPQIKYALARDYVRTGDLARARDLLSEALTIAPSYSAPALMLAELDLRQSDAADALKIASSVLQREPRNTQAPLVIAQADLAENNPQAALEAYRRMAETFPRDPVPLYRAALLQMRLHQPERAQAALEKAHAVAPTYMPVIDLLITLDLEQGHRGTAEARVDALLAQYPKSGFPWVLRGRIDGSAHRYDAAETDLLKAIAVQPDFSSAYFLLARLYLATHRTNQAIQRLADLVKKTKSVQAQLQIAAIHQETGQYAMAAADYRFALTLDPRNALALNNLAFLECDRLHDLDAAYADARRARELAPEDAEVADTLGWVLVQRGDFHGGLALFEEAAGRQPDEAAIQYHLGYAHYMLGEEDAARLAFERALSSRPSDSVAAAAREYLALLAIDPAHATAAQRSELRREAAANPQDPVAASRLAALEADHGGAAAAAALENALKLSPDNTGLMLQLAQLDSGPLHRPDRARALAKHAHELAPDDPQIALTLGRLLYRIGDYQWSLDLLEQAGRQLPVTPDLSFDLALDEIAVGRLADARSALQTAASAAGFARASDAARLAALVDAAGDPAAAQAALGAAQAALAADPHSLPALMVMALAREEAGDAPAAIRQYEAILSTDPSFVPAAERLAVLYTEQGGNDDRAFALAQQADEAYPDDPVAESTLGRLDFRREDYEAGAQLLRQSLQSRPDDAETLYFLGMCHYRLHENDAAKAELRRSLDLKLAGQEGEDARHALDELNGNVNGPSLTSQPIN